MTSNVALKDRVDRSLVEGHVWQRATFTVPASTPHERVRFHFDEYVKRAAQEFERQGYHVLEYTEPAVYLEQHLPTDEDRRRYDFWLKCRKRPHVIKLEVEEELIPEMLQKGLKLA